MAYPAPEDISYDEESRWCQDHGHTGILAGCPACEYLVGRDPRFAAAIAPGGPHNPDGSLAGAWWVVCVEHVVGPFPDKVQADARLVEMTQNPGGYSCRRDHWVKKSDIEPDPDYPPDGWTPVLPATN